ncbi:TetR/AcrR family transcriptional regulator [Microbacterium sp. P06]|uniref:TetR/AcrR family transcriptional regulator n=1 Tax=Microbacterium sp. P06 TaxID=3366949 RepID=UPI0037471269
MTIEERRARDRTARRRLITSTARSIAEKEGWDAVTTRRLSTEIEYSQPVIYKHFASLDEITDAVALEGFEELAIALRKARLAAAADGAVGAVARTYAAFATDAPALYDAMFVISTRLPFGAHSPTALSVAFAEMRAAIAPRVGGEDVDVLTEVLWAALHGLVVLDRAGRIEQGRLDDRIDVIVNRLVVDAS